MILLDLKGFFLNVQVTKLPSKKSLNCIEMLNLNFTSGKNKATVVMIQTHLNGALMLLFKRQNPSRLSHN